MKGVSGHGMVYMSECSYLYISSDYLMLGKVSIPHKLSDLDATSLVQEEHILALLDCCRAPRECS